MIYNSENATHFCKFGRILSESSDDMMLSDSSDDIMTDEIRKMKYC